DLMMPCMNGYELIQEIRSVFEIRKLPIIMCSGAQNRDRIKELGLDISDYLDKPVTAAGVLACIERALALPPRPDSPDRPAAAPSGGHVEETLDGEDVLKEVEMIKEADEDAEAGIESVADDSPLISRVNKILVRAVEVGASDIHVEPQEAKT